MTLFEAIRANPSLAEIQDQTIIAYCTSRGADSGDDYTAADLQTLELVTADLYLEMATQPEFTEGSLSIKRNLNILLRRARNIYLKYEDDKASDVSGTLHQPGIRKL
jgi:peptide deformylase